MLRLVLAFAAAPLALAPANAADVKTIDCVQTTVDAATLRSLKVDVEKNFADLDNQSYSPETIAGMGNAARACMVKYNWSDKAAEAAVLYALSALAQPVARAHAIPARIDYAAIERRFAALTYEERIDAMQDAVLDKLAQGALDAKEIDDDNAKVAGGIFGLLAVHAKALSDFAAN